MKQIVQIISIAFILTSCFQNKSEIVKDNTADIQISSESENIAPQEFSSTDQVSTEEKQHSETDTLFNSELIHDWSKEIMTSDLLEKQFNYRADTVKNIHWPEQIDSLLYYTTETSKVQIYRSFNKDILLDTDLFDSDITLSSKIKIGSPKKEVSQILLEEIRSNILMVHDEDSDISFTFYFMNDSLYHIHYNSYID
ncbi:MAG: hypothetical protein ACJA1C_000633 [Crocinitomicaceae bacterium]|jgi:hypothetical protein